MSFRKIWDIALKEYRVYFASPVAYVVAGLFFFLSSWMFFQILSYAATNSWRQAMMGGGHGGMNLSEQVFGPHFGNINVVLLIMIPALTMRLFAEEKKNHTIDLLMTSPLTSADVVIGKFLAGLFIVWTVVATMAIYPVVTRFFAGFDVGPVLTSFLGLALLSAVYVAIGVFASSLTESVIIAYFVAFVITLFFWVVGWASASLDSTVAQGVFNYVSITSHFADFTKGVIDTSGIVYYVSLTFFFCFLTHQVVESTRWR